MNYCINNYNINESDNPYYSGGWSHNGTWNKLKTCKAILNDWPLNESHSIHVISEKIRPFRRVRIEGRTIKCYDKNENTANLVRGCKKGKIWVVIKVKGLFNKTKLRWYSVVSEVAYE